MPDQREHDRREDEHAHVPQRRRAQREHQVGDDGDEHDRRRELVHVAPGQPVGGQAAGDQDARCVRAPSDGQPDADRAPAVRDCRRAGAGRPVRGRRSSRLRPHELAGRPAAEGQLRAEGDERHRVHRDADRRRRCPTGRPATGQESRRGYLRVRACGCGPSDERPARRPGRRSARRTGARSRRCRAAARRASARYRRRRRPPAPGRRRAPGAPAACRAGRASSAIAERQHPHLAGVVRVLQRGELAVAGEGDRRAVGQLDRLPDRQVRRRHLAPGCRGRSARRRASTPTAGCRSPGRGSPGRRRSRPAAPAAAGRPR